MVSVVFRTEKQFVCINNLNSKLVDLKYGVPQGSVLDTVLFSLYSSSLADMAKTHGMDDHLYANDREISDL